MRIFEKEPTSWRQLERRVELILEEAGFEVKLNAVISLVRGDKNVDLLAIDNETTPTVRVICECKHWNRQIPKETVHAFRTVIQDSGVNVGYIISKSKFQSGSLEAADRTPIRLVTYREFEEEYFRRWNFNVKRHLIKHVELARHYMECIDPDFVGRRRLSKQLMKRADFVWERTEILRFDDLTDPEAPIRDWYHGPRPGDYSGKTTTVTIEGRRDYIRWLLLTGSWVMHSVTALAASLGTPLYRGNTVLAYELLHVSVPPRAVEKATKKRFDWDQLKVDP